MSTFSQRHGYKSIKSIMQIESIDDDLRIKLWNALGFFYWDKVHNIYHIDHEINAKIFWLIRSIYQNILKKPIDTISRQWVKEYVHIRGYYFKSDWNEVYDFIEFVANSYIEDQVNENFMFQCNLILKTEMSGYRFIDKKITQITSEEEISEIEEAIKQGKKQSPEIVHLTTALSLLSDRKTPDYRNSIKESISAVEAVCRKIAGNKATLGKALTEIQKSGKIDLHKALEDAFEKLYGYTSDAGGIRHSLLEETDLDFEDAKFMLVSCSAFINYLKVKTSKAGIKID